MSGVSFPFTMKFRCARALLAIASCTFVLSMAIGADASPFVYYFDATTSNGVNSAGTSPSSIGAMHYDESTNSFWIAGYQSDTRHLRHLTPTGSTWAPSGTLITSGPFQGAHVTTSSWATYIVSDNTKNNSSPNENSWTHNIILPAAMALNPQPLTINGQTYAANSLLLMNHFGGVPTNGLPTSNPGYENYPQYAKRLYWYNLTETGTPTPAGPNAAPGASTIYTNDGVVNWNEQFHTIITHQDMQTAAGSTSTSSNMGRDFAFSNDGQSVYMNDSSSAFGGLYKVDLTTTGAITQVISNAGAGVRIEPSVVKGPHQYGFSGTGDVIVYRGSASTGNANGIDLWFDPVGPTFGATPINLISESQFQDFADITGSFNPVVSGTDNDGNIYIYDNTTEMVFRYDPQGRMVKIASEEQRDTYALSVGASPHNSFSELQFHTNTTAESFPLTEMMFKNSGLDAPTGLLIYEIGDFDQNGEVDAVDKANFLAALRPRLQGNPGVANQVFDLNGNSTGPSYTSPLQVLADSIVDWKDVKILQQFLDFPNGDTNLDGLLDFTDLNTVRDNYYDPLDLVNSLNKTWADGDFASLDPFANVYSSMALDANIVDKVDLDLLAYTWLDVLDQENLTWADLDIYGYEGQFRLDVIDAFNLQVAAAAAAPEPSSCCLLAIGLCVLARRRRCRLVVAA